MELSEQTYMNARDAYEYARRIGHRVHGLEHIIRQNPYWARTYAIDVIGGRWPIAEGIIISQGSAFIQNSYWAMVNGTVT